jgi:poly-gamma-glutamate capsule biosynthesis protein CapA/YwtB (metallophosphatase superfamily)
MTREGKIRIAAVGDIALNGAYKQMAGSPERNAVFAGLSGYLGGAELAIGNLEGPLTERRPLDRSSRFCLRGHPRYAAVLQAAGFKVLSLANNHILDFGWEAVEDTILELAAVGICVVGAGKNLEDARKPVQLSIGGVNLSVLAYCGVPTGLPIYAAVGRPGVAPASVPLMFEDIAAAKKNCDFLIVCVHWGQEHVGYPTPRQRRMARTLGAAGANLIIGHHPHVLQGVEGLPNGWVAYSLGNFIFSEEQWTCTESSGRDNQVTYTLSEAARQSALWMTEVDTNTLEITQELIPVYLGKNLCPRPDFRPDRLSQIAQGNAALRRPFYTLVWFCQMLWSRLHAQWEEISQGQSIWKRLGRLRPRHMKDLARLVSREWRHLQGVK